MTIRETLDSVRTSVPGCTVAALGDASTRLILRSSHNKDIRREYLDALCDDAARHFNLLDAAADLGRAPGDPGNAPNEALALTRRNAAVFVRTDHSSSEFLCLVCAGHGDNAAIFTAAHRALHDISQAQS